MRFVSTITLLLVTVSTTHAQTPSYEKLVPMELSTALPKAPYYKAVDTLKANFHVQAGEKVQVVGRLAPNLAVVNRQGFLYYMPARYLDGFSLVPGTPAWVDAVDKLPADEKGHITYSGVVQVEGVTQNELYARGKVWFAQAFKSAQNVVQADDKEAGVLVGKGLAYVEVGTDMVPWQQRLHFTVKLAFKAGRYKYEFTDFTFQNPVTSYILNPGEESAESVVNPDAKLKGAKARMQTDQKNELNHVTKGMVRELREAMQKPAAGSDW